MGSMTPMLDDAARDPEHPTREQRYAPPTDGEALAVLEQAVAHLATCPRCRLDVSCVDGAALGEAAAWLWHTHHNTNPRDAEDTGAGGGG
jgi:hypothetical protein